MISVVIHYAAAAAAATITATDNKCWGASGFVAGQSTMDTILAFCLLSEVHHRFDRRVPGHQGCL